jgi:hypothetical protein
MYLVLIAWIYVALMMAIAEATSPVGTLLGAVFTFLLYGVLPMSVVGYIMGSPARRSANKAKEAAERAQANSTSPDAQRETPSQAVSSERKEF